MLFKLKRNGQVIKGKLTSIRLFEFKRLIELQFQIAPQRTWVAGVATYHYVMVCKPKWLYLLCDWVLMIRNHPLTKTIPPL